MKLILLNNVTIREVKKQFSIYFPYLKLEFYQAPHRRRERSESDELLIDELTLAELGVMANQPEFSFDQTTTVTAFEQGLQNGYNLPVQVFRRAGGTWLQTVQSDDLTLKEENTKGEQSLQVEKFNEENQW